MPELVDNIHSGVVRISKIVSGLKTYSHSGGLPNITACDINKCINDAMALCQHRFKSTIRIILNVAQKLPTVNADSQKIEQVMVNLLMNAADAVMEKGGGDVTITTQHEATMVMVTVADTGKGIVVQNIDQIFDPFFTTKSRDNGTGLGLAICRSIISDHHGTISATNRLDGGAKFTFTLPCTE